MRRTCLVLFAATFAACCGPAFGQSEEINVDVRERVLSNGMTVLVLERHTAPVFSALIRFNVGSVDERPGITGISHLLEHMMFKGTKIFGTGDYEAEIPLMNRIDSLARLMFAEQVRLQNPLGGADSTRYRELREQIAEVQAEQKQYVIKDELWSIYLKNGGTHLNAGTGNDGTSYIVSLPKNRLELWALLEADRFRDNVFREFYSERDVVMEERRLSENDPWHALDQAFSATMFWSTPYKWPVVGWMSDLNRISREDVEEYFKTRYVPANAVVVIVGDVDAEEVFNVCEKYLGKIPSGPLPPATMTIDAPQSGERRAEVEYDTNPIALLGWKIPRFGHPDIPALEVIANILASGRTSRFYRNIKEKKLGSVTAKVSETRLPGAFYCKVTPMGDHGIAELEEAIYDEIERLKTEPVTDWELEKVRNKFESSMLRRLDSNMGMAWRLSWSRIVTRDWRYFIDKYEAIKKVSAEDVMRVAKKYLKKSNRSIAYMVRPKGEDNIKQVSKSS